MQHENTQVGLTQASGILLPGIFEPEVCQGVFSVKAMQLITCLLAECCNAAEKLQSGGWGLCLICLGSQQDKAARAVQDTQKSCRLIAAILKGLHADGCSDLQLSFSFPGAKINDLEQLRLF